LLHQVSKIFFSTLEHIILPIVLLLRGLVIVESRAKVKRRVGKTKENNKREGDQSEGMTAVTRREF
jgi:hypothetical protein